MVLVTAEVEAVMIVISIWYGFDESLYTTSSV